MIGTVDERWGEAIVATGVLRPGQSLMLDELNAFAERQLARYKLPKHLQIVGALPRGTTGKVLKYLLRPNSLKHSKGSRADPSVARHPRRTRKCAPLGLEIRLTFGYLLDYGQEFSFCPLFSTLP